MKKILVLMVAVFAMNMTASAQKITEEERNNVITNLIGRMKPVDGSWLITPEPISYYEFWVVKRARRSTTPIPACQTPPK